MASGVELEALEDTVEVVDRAREVAIHVHFRLARLDLQPHRAHADFVIGPGGAPHAVVAPESEPAEIGRAHV